MPLEYKNICIALYDYSAQDSEEISFKEDDILYILENDDEEWWKAKLKIANEEGEEGADGPIGVVPSNYIQEAECSAVMKALYDYDAQSDEELTFKENDILYLYDKDDPDWYLVKLNDVFGFVPAAFVEEFSPDEDEQPSESLPGNQKSLSDAISNAPEQNGNYVAPLQAYARKVAHQKSSGPFEVKTWSVSEYSSDKKKKKKKGTLSIGGDKIFYASESDKAPVQQWNINELSDVKYEKKRITISISGEKAAKFDFNTSKGDAEAIYNKIQESLARLELPTVKLDTPSRSSTHQVQEYEEEYEEAYEEEQEPEVIEDETEEVNEEDLPPPKFGIALYDFEAQGDDEITIHQGDRLWVIDDVSSKDWWTIRKGDEEGAVPSSYIEIRGDPDSDNAEEEKRLKLEEQIRIKQEEERLKKEEERLRKEEERLLKEEERRKREEKENERKRRDEEKRLQEEKKQNQALQSQTPPALPNRQPTRSNSPLDDEVTKKAQTPTNRASTERQIQTQTQTKSKSIPSKTRTWSDRTGAFKVEAQFLQYIDGKVHLHKLNGVKIAVPIERMSKSDLTYLEGITGEKFDDRTDDIPLAAIAAAHRGKATLTNSRKADYDWFNFFLKADIAHEDAFEYARAFVEEKLDESSIPDLNDELMKGLGVRVGDIIRIKKYVAEKHNKKRNVSFGATSIIPDEKTDENDQDYAKKIQDEEYERRLQEKRDEEFARELQDEENRIARSEGRTIPKEADLYGNLDSIVQKDDKKTSPKSAPLLFVESNGALKNNTKKARPSPSKAAPIQIDSSALTVPKDKLDAAFKSSTSPAEKFEDDAWLSSDKTPVLLPKPIAKPVSTSPPPPPPPPPNHAVLQNSQIINSNPPVLPQPRQRSVSPLLSQQPQQPVTNTSISDFNSNSWNSNPNLPPAQNFQSSQMTLMTFQSSQMALQPPINTQTPSLPPAPLAAAVVPLNTILHQPLIPMKNEIPSQFSTLPITNINNLRNNNQGLMGNLPVNNYSPGNTWNNSGIVPTPLPVETHSGYSTLGVTNQFNANFNTENQIQPTLLNTPQLPPTTTQSSACDPKVVFAAMKTGQIGPNIIPNATDDKYSAFKQVDLQGPSVFNGPTPNQLSTNGYNLGQNPGVLNTPSWNQTATSGFSGMGVPQQNPSYPPLANPNVNFGLNGQQPPNQQGFNNTPGYNNLNQNHKW